MDVKEYIASGILESYAMGSVSAQERKEVECLSKIYPEIREELNAIEVSIEKYAQSIAVKPPQELKSKILSAIRNAEQEEPLKVSKPDSTADTAKVKDISKSKTSKTLQMIAAAAVIVILAGASIWQYGKISTLENQIASTKAENLNKEESIANLNSKLEAMAEEKLFLLNENTKEILLAGTDFSKQSKVRLYWNNKENKYSLTADQLPVAQEGKQYQIWAISKGQPVSIGLLNKSNELDKIASLETDDIQAFAITLENEGGSKTPTLEKMMVIGTTGS